ncbi:MAG: site-specific DNA-methyltransferase [Acidobacteriota bacterium]|nr:site-specific DNA-methyltransferase [Acidobacteriota bacterium]
MSWNLMLKTRADLTFKHNIKRGRHGWLRLTPAYSIKVVHEILEQHPKVKHVLDPFSGTGTTGLVCAELGLNCDLIDINPFLIWLARVKTANYTSAQCLETKTAANDIAHSLRNASEDNLSFPPIKNIERWWSEHKRVLLAQIHREIHQRFPAESPSQDLLLIAFCRLIIEWSNAAFNHQSMSFKDNQSLLFETEGRGYLLSHFENTVHEIIEAATIDVSGNVNVKQADSRDVPLSPNHLYDCVITSPPYPNRMSYIRELRPYMYWLGYLKEAREAGELDWKAIGGTWGIATSRVEKWQPNGVRIKHSGFDKMIGEISEQSKVLANYVHKYFVDAVTHLTSAYQTVAPNGKVFYIVGNSKFYNTLVPVEDIYVSILKQCGFIDTQTKILRKRNSKKELKELVVTARKPCS